jgi:hypothetical protein
VYNYLGALYMQESLLSGSGKGEVRYVVSGRWDMTSKKNIRIIVLMALFFSSVFPAVSRAFADDAAGQLSSASIRSELEQTKREVLKGLEGCLRSDSGLLFTNTQERTFLSETVGLEMMLHLARGDRRAFDRQVKLLKSHFIGPLGLLPWKLEENLIPAEPWNASVDDLRVARALILSDRLWKIPDNIRIAESIGGALLQYNVVDGVLVDGCSWRKPGLTGKTKVDKVYGTSTLAYADIGAMNLLAEIDPGWVPVFQRMSGVLLGGLIGRDSPWWLFNPGENSYEETDLDDEVIGKALSLLYLAEAGFVHPPTLEAFSSAALSGKLLDRYGNENISVISIAALYLFNSGKRTEALAVLGRLLDFRNDAPALSGLLGYEESEGKFSAWAFDNLLALLAMEEILGSGK